MCACECFAVAKCTKSIRIRTEREVQEDWLREIQYFVANIVMPQVEASGPAAR